MKLLDILIPVRNESQNLPELIRRLDRTLKKAKVKYRLICIDDRSTDNSLDTLRKLARRFPMTVRQKQGKIGKAYSILEAAALSKAKYVAMIDADLQYPPEAIPQMLKLAPDAGIVVANRRRYKASRLRWFISRTNRFLLGRLLLGMDFDVQSGLKLFRREIITHLDASRVDEWTLDMPLLFTARQLGYSVKTVEIDFAPRTNGKSHVSVCSAAAQILYRAVATHLTASRILHLSPTGSRSSLGAGVAVRGRRFITHSRLPLIHSALVTFYPWQKAAIAALLLLLAVSLYYSPLNTSIVFISILSLVYFADVLFNLFLVSKSLQSPPEYSFDPGRLRGLDNTGLPVYTILCPLYRESRILGQFLEGIAGLDWPKSKLDVLLLLEEDDTETIEAAKKLQPPSYVRTIIVPHSFPKTKPKACNYGLALAKGEYLVIYDAEDKPDSDQLKKAYLAFLETRPDVICLQAKLNYYNPEHNLLTRLFTAEYSLWFDVILPGLQSIETAIPLGGTSNHFHTSVLRQLHGWDAFNVTEDCDLGSRLFKAGYRTAIIDSSTYEEANSRLGNWLRQRSRWIKGYIQTYLVHNRHPLSFIRKSGVHAFIFQLVVGGKIAFMLINPFLWALTISYFAFRAAIGPVVESLYPGIFFYIAVFSAVTGNFLYVYYYMIGVAKRGQWNLIKYVFLIPVYWLLVSVAAFKAAWQLIFRPHYWEKTPHGFHLSAALPVKPFPMPRPRIAWNLSFSNIISGAALVSANLGTSILNFFYQIYLGRSASLEEFGTIGLIMAIVNFSQIPLGALAKTVSYRSAYILGRYRTSAGVFWSTIRLRSFIFALLFTVVWILGIPVMTGFFRTSDILPFILFAPVWGIGALTAVDSGFISGSHRFLLLALLTVFETLLKFIITIGLVNVGLTAYVYAAFPASSLISVFVGWRAAVKIKNNFANAPTVPSRRFPRRFFTASLITAVSSVAFLSVDIVLAKHFLSPSDAGIYALLSLVGKMIFFGGSLFTQFITPVVSRSEGAGGNSRTKFYLLLSATVFSALAGWLVLGLFGGLTVPLILGKDRTVVLLPYLTLYTLSMAAFTIAGSFITYHQIKKQYSYSALSLIFVGMQIGGIYMHHSNIAAITSVILTVSGLYLGTVVLAHLYAEYLGSFVRNIFNMKAIFGSIPAPAADSPAKLRILIFNWRDIRHVWAGGAEVYVHELARRWVAQGHHVTLFCSSDRQSLPNEKIDGVEIIRRGGFFTVYPWAVVYYLLHLRGKFDLLIDSENGIPFFTPLFAGIPKILLIHHIHRDYFAHYAPPFLSRIGWFLESRLMPYLYRRLPIVTVSESSRRDIVDLIRPTRPVNIIHPGVDLKKISPSRPKTPYPSFIYLGRIRPYKNVHIAVEAFARLYAIYPEARLVIAGWGESLPYLKKLVRHLRLESVVEFAYKVTDEQKIGLLSQSWAMVQPSSMEGWGITVVEANACGTPVIASDVKGLRDSVVPGRTGLLVPPRDVSSLFAAMETLITDGILLERISSQALSWASGFEWDEISLKFLNTIYSSLEGTLKSPGTVVSPALARN